jgi:biotin synthase-related radical SAM superfamily protein
MLHLIAYSFMPDLFLNKPPILIPKGKGDEEAEIIHSVETLRVAQAPFKPHGCHDNHYYAAASTMNS